MIMRSAAIDWLLSDGNPAVSYRTHTEIIGNRTDKAPVIEWAQALLPDGWQDQKGLWSTYYLTAVAECGLRHDDLPMDIMKAVDFGHPFGHSCGDFMRLRALVMLGLADLPEITHIIENLQKAQLPDGGFLCRGRLRKLSYQSKSCAKANLHALLCCAEAKKKGIKLGIEAALIDYFWQHRLFYKKIAPDKLMLDGRAGWRNIDTFHPFEPMRVGLHNVIEALCALGYGHDDRLDTAWTLLHAKADRQGRYPLEGTLTKSYLPKARVGKPSEWVTFYAELAESEM